MTATADPIRVPDMCQKHQSLLVHQAGYAESDPWRALIMVAQFVLVQALSCDEAAHQRIDGDIYRIGELGCLACYRPDAFGEIVEAAKTHDLKRVKAVGDRWIEASRRTP